MSKKISVFAKVFPLLRVLPPCRQCFFVVSLRLPQESKYIRHGTKIRAKSRFSACFVKNFSNVFLPSPLANGGKIWYTSFDFAF
ncbi:MAG TPA: hypothetical protein DCE08_06920 [Ruminococcaceae bacterium]|nr:hypothetical protein [Oscillospiraceae bacterium]